MKSKKPMEIKIIYLQSNRIKKKVRLENTVKSDYKIAFKRLNFNTRFRRENIFKIIKNNYNNYRD